ncbi:MAG: arsenate reductase (glutaredoxin) [Thalassotalea sp.]
MLTIYHNPRCSKSRQTLQLIEAAGKEVTVVEYLKTPLTESEITSLLALLQVSPIEMMRTKEAEFKTQNLKGTDEQTLINAMVNTPKLIERPIVTSGTHAIIGRPPENVLTLW